MKRLLMLLLMATLPLATHGQSARSRTTRHARRSSVRQVSRTPVPQEATAEHLIAHLDAEGIKPGRLQKTSPRTLAEKQALIN